MEQLGVMSRFRIWPAVGRAIKEKDGETEGRLGSQSQAGGEGGALEWREPSSVTHRGGGRGPDASRSRR